MKIVTGGGHVYPSVEDKELRSFITGWCRKGSAKTTGFPGISREERPEGGERKFVYKKIVFDDHGNGFLPPLGLGTTSADFSFGFFLNGL